MGSSTADGLVLFGQRHLDVDGGEDGEDVRLQAPMKISSTTKTMPKAKVPTPSRPSGLPPASTVKKKKLVARKHSASSMCPATMFMVSRRVSVIGRRMKVDRNSRSTMIGVISHGTRGNERVLEEPGAVLADARVDESSRRR